MANRTIEVGGVWADGAPDPPATPVAGTTYADSGLTEGEINEGWPFQNIVDSAMFNELMRRVTAVMQLVEQWGILPWSSLTTYAAGARVIGSDGKAYVAINPTTGDDPVSAPAGNWSLDNLADHAALTTAHGAVSAATPSRIVVRDANGRAQVADPSALADIATKGYVDGKAEGTANLVQDGSVVLPNGLILNWGKIPAQNWSYTGTQYTITFDEPFTTAAFAIFAQIESSVAFTSLPAMHADLLSLTQGRVTSDNSGSVTENFAVFWWAIGY